MPKKSYRSLAQERKNRRGYLWEALKRNPVYIRFKELSAGASGDELQVLIDFLKTPEGEALARRKNLYPPIKPPVQVVPHQRARIIDRKLDISPHLQKGRFLKLKLDLTESLTVLRPGIEFEIMRYRKHVVGRPDRVRGKSKAEPLGLNIKGRRLYVKLDLFQRVDILLSQIDKAIREHRPQVQPKQKTRGPDYDLEDLKLYDRVRAGTSFHAIEKEDDEDAKREKARRAARKITKLSK